MKGLFGSRSKGFSQSDLSTSGARSFIINPMAVDIQAGSPASAYSLTFPGHLRNLLTVQFSIAGERDRGIGAVRCREIIELLCPLKLSVRARPHIRDCSE